MYAGLWGDGTERTCQMFWVEARGASWRDNPSDGFEGDMATLTLCVRWPWTLSAVDHGLRVGRRVDVLSRSRYLVTRSIRRNCALLLRKGSGRPATVSDAPKA